jgi:hypothetical protein
MKAILKNKKYARPCPSCGNSTVFDVQSIRSGVDCCDIYVECMECGYDPTKCHPGYRYEDVWGVINYGTTFMAIACWNDAIDEFGYENDSESIIERTT